MHEPSVEVSVVIPCLNEERTVGACVKAAFDGIHSTGLPGEVIVADNGSSDHSIARAQAAGARLVQVSRRGYGAALHAGFLAARGRLLIMGDADLSYDFRDIPAFVAEQQRTQAEMVIGDRFRGRIEPGAMPWSHRLFGNPLISWTIRCFFGAPVKDCYCGLRLITREAYRRLHMSATGMEYALEMVLLTVLSGMRIAQIPITLYVDGRDRPPHLKTFRDGYRSFRFLFQHAPITMYLLPGSLLVLGALAQFAVLAAQELLSGTPMSVVRGPLAAGALIIGWLMVLLGLIARVFAAGFLASRVDPVLRKLFSFWNLEHSVTMAGVGFGLGLGALLYGVSRSPALFLLGIATLIMAIGTFLGAFVVSLMGRAVPDNRFYPVQDNAEEASHVSLIPAGGGDTIPQQHECYSLNTQAALAHAHHYNEWLFDTLHPAVRGARRVLDVGCSIGNITGIAARHIMREANTESGVVIVGLELMAEAVNIFQERYSHRPEMQVIQGDILVPPSALLALGPFDSAMSLNVLEHIEDDVAALRAIGACLRPGGSLGLFVPGGGTWLYGTLDALDGHFRRYTRPWLRARLEAAGYEVLSIRPVNCVGFFLWFLQGRVLRSKAIEGKSLRWFDRCVPVCRQIDRLFGPLFGQSLAAIARWPGQQAP